MDREPLIETYFKGVTAVLIGVLTLFCIGVPLILLTHVYLLVTHSPEADWRSIPIGLLMLAIAAFARLGLLKLLRAIEKHGAIYPPE